MNDGLLLLDATDLAFSSEGEAEALAGAAGVVAAEIVACGTCNMFGLPSQRVLLLLLDALPAFCFGRHLGSTIDGSVIHISCGIDRVILRPTFP